jgi:hypothetical protein
MINNDVSPNRRSDIWQKEDDWLDTRFDAPTKKPRRFGSGLRFRRGCRHRAPRDTRSANPTLPLLANQRGHPPKDRVCVRKTDLLRKSRELRQVKPEKSFGPPIRLNRRGSGDRRVKDFRFRSVFIAEARKSGNAEKNFQRLRPSAFQRLF